MTKQELIEIFTLDGKPLGTIDRKFFQKESKEEFLRDGKITRKKKGIHIMLMKPNGELYIQKRSLTKSDNTGLFDKSIGGHVTAGDSWQDTAIRETKEELDIDLIVTKDNKDFHAALRRQDFSKEAIVRFIDQEDHCMSYRKRKDTDIIEPEIRQTFIGYYDGPFSFHDGEVSEVIFKTREELKEDMDKRPEQYTQDLVGILEKYWEYLVPLSI